VRSDSISWSKSSIRKGRSAREREDVDDVAALADLARALGERRARVADLDELLEQLRDVEVRADLQMEELALEVLRAGHRLQQRQERRDRDPRPPLARPREDLRRLQAHAQRVRVDVAAAERADVARRQHERRESRGRQVLREALASVSVEHGRGTAQRMRVVSAREHERLRRAPQVAGGDGARLAESREPLDARARSRAASTTRAGRGTERGGRRPRPARLTATSWLLRREDEQRFVRGPASASLRVRPQALGKRRPAISAATGRPWRGRGRARRAARSSAARRSASAWRCSTCFSFGRALQRAHALQRPLSVARAKLRAASRPPSRYTAPSSAS
jgi:hypothetical protein